MSPDRVWTNTMNATSSLLRCVSWCSFNHPTHLRRLLLLLAYGCDRTSRHTSHPASNNLPHIVVQLVDTVLLVSEICWARCRHLEAVFWVFVEIDAEDKVCALQKDQGHCSAALSNGRDPDLVGIVLGLYHGKRSGILLVDVEDSFFKVSVSTDVSRYVSDVHTTELRIEVRSRVGAQL